MRMIDAEQFGVVSLQGKSEDFIEGAMFILDKIDEAQTVEERPHGEWKLVQRGESIDIVCPFCGYVREDSIAYGYTTEQVEYSIKHGVFGYDFPNFCEECGAKMGLKEGDLEVKELEEIKPCPFCGGDAKMEESSYCRPVEGWLQYAISCEDCGCEMLGESINPYQEEPEKATESVIAKWNMREGE